MSKKHEHPSHAAQLKKLNRVAGQIDGLKKMIEERRYCPDILTQCRAARAAIKSIEAEIMTRHLQHCVQHALENGDAKNVATKLEEIEKIFAKYSD
ncbi:MAG: metal-sensitive transcriptional regulator [Alphaproteobacteria bacterium]|nr:metal-sensitive transcriptional regulator [Alphaproteobacteria bacterium]